MALTPADLRALRRARDLMDRRYADPLDVDAMAAAAHMSTGHFHRSFKDAFGETPYTYLMTRRIERAMALLRDGVSVTDACFAVGASSLGSFSSRFTEVVGMSPSAYRAADHPPYEEIPACIARIIGRPPRYPAPASAPGHSVRPGSDRSGSEKPGAAPPA